MLKWILLIVVIVVACVIGYLVRDMSHRNRLVIAQRNKSKCPSCGANIGSMFTSADANALETIKKTIANAPKDMRVTPAGHPVELNCIHCGELLLFQLDDSVTSA